ncbi:MAG TPA: pyridoxamine 5'-phosphate oxidase [Blastocatellia bacterium]|nr:pyridoxamine 5'-phosphate oxidase [Blastocatellia bacterium]
MENISQQITQMRHEYISQPFNKSEVASDPINQFKSWFEEAVQSAQPDVDAMTLSTATSDGRVSARIVLLKGCDERGFVFFTNYESRKGREMMSNPHVALTFYWHTLHRQVRIEGVVEKVTPEESEEYFQTRPRGSQIGAWASPQSEEIDNRTRLERRVEETEAQFKDRPINCPPFWGGFRVKPDRIEFWQGRENRLHDRILYALRDTEWRISRLAP